MFAAFFRISILGKLRDNCSFTWRQSRCVLLGCRFRKTIAGERPGGTLKGPSNQPLALHSWFLCTYGRVWQPLIPGRIYTWNLFFPIDFLICCNENSEWVWEPSQCIGERWLWRRLTTLNPENGHRCPPTAQILAWSEELSALGKSNPVYKTGLGTSVSVLTEVRCPVKPHRRLALQSRWFWGGGTNWLDVPQNPNDSSLWELLYIWDTCFILPDSQPSPGFLHFCIWMQSHKTVSSAGLTTKCSALRDWVKKANLKAAFWLVFRKMNLLF